MRKFSISLLALSFALMMATGCKKKAETTEGPMESAGEEADRAGERVEESVEEAGDNVEDATD